MGKVTEEVSHGLFVLGTQLATTAPLAIIGYYGYRWLRDGEWPLLPVSDVLEVLRIPPPHIGWVGLQRIIDWGLDAPLWAGSCVLGLVLMGLSYLVDDPES